MGLVGGARSNRPDHENEIVTLAQHGEHALVEFRQMRQCAFASKQLATEFAFKSLDGTRQSRLCRSAQPRATNHWKYMDYDLEKQIKEEKIRMNVQPTHFLLHLRCLTAWPKSRTKRL